MEIFAKLADGVDSSVRNITALIKNKVAKSRRCRDYSVYSDVCDFLTCGQVENSKCIIDSGGRK
jgi:hypothetical protein